MLLHRFEVYGAQSGVAFGICTDTSVGVVIWRMFSIICLASSPRSSEEGLIGSIIGQLSV